MDQAPSYTLDEIREGLPPDPGAGSRKRGARKAEAAKPQDYDVNWPGDDGADVGAYIDYLKRQTPLDPSDDSEDKARNAAIAHARVGWDKAVHLETNQDLFWRFWASRPRFGEDYPLWTREQADRHVKNAYKGCENLWGCESAFVHAFQDEGSDQHRFRAWTFDELLAEPDPEWLIPGYVEEGTIGCGYGLPSALKSFVALDFSLSLATGERPLGFLGLPSGTMRLRKTEYIAGEGAGGIKRRIAAWINARAGADDEKRKRLRERIKENFRVIRRMPNLSPESPDGDALIAEVRAFGAEFIVIDTYFTLSGGFDINAPKDSGIVWGWILKLRNETKATIFGIHHQGKDAAAGEFGSIMLRANIDWSYRFVRSDVKKLHTEVEATKPPRDDEAPPKLYLEGKKIADGAFGTRGSIVLGKGEPQTNEGSGQYSDGMVQKALWAIGDGQAVAVDKALAYALMNEWGEEIEDGEEHDKRAGVVRDYLKKLIGQGRFAAMLVLKNGKPTKPPQLKPPPRDTADPSDDDEVEI